MKRQHKPSEFVLTPQEVKIIIHSCTSFRDRTLLKSLYYGGLRRSEAAALKVTDIDFMRREINIRESKYSKSRVIPIINFEFMGDLKHLIGEKKDGGVFLNQKGNSISMREVNYIVQKAGEKANLKHPNPSMKHINPHLFRHSISRHLKSMGFSIEFIQNFLGHSSYKTTMDEYGTMSLSDMKTEANRKLGLVQEPPKNLIE